MPNSRRRKFSVRNEISRKEPNRKKHKLQTSTPEPDIEIKVKTPINTKTKNKSQPNSSKNESNMEIIPECKSSTSMVTVKKYSHTTVDKNVTASSSNIDLFTNIAYASKDFSELEIPWKIDCTDTLNNIGGIGSPPNVISQHETRDSTQIKKEKHRQHRIKVRSPKRRMGIGIVDAQNKNNDINKLSVNIGTDSIEWERDAVICVDILPNVAETIEDDGRQSDHSSDDMCRICHGSDSLSSELGQLISACSCRGSVGRVHVKCLERWLTESGKTRCELCGTRYVTQRVHRYGVVRALFMWILSQNAKQLMVDSLGIMLMSPLAVLAAWLSGRTLAGLMMHDAHATPWPLASTFVLACMTLVCYYCWIVSAATRHALGWWVWYRSQYEVRLQYMDVEE